MALPAAPVNPSVFDTVFGGKSPHVGAGIHHFEARIPVAPEPSEPDQPVILDGYVAMPDGEGPFPVVILPAPLIQIGWRAYWPISFEGETPGPTGGEPAEPTLHGLLPQLAKNGYIAVGYSERGLARSGGLIDVAGPHDQADGSRVIDWVLETLGEKADPDRIGFAGASYGGGQSLLIAARDNRVKAVAAMSAWADLAAGLFENDTRHIAAFRALRNLFENQVPPIDPEKPDPMPGVTRLNPETFDIFLKYPLDDYRQHLPQLLDYAAKRSPIAPEILAKLNQDGRDLPIVLCTYWHETIFSNRAVVDLFNQLATPNKRLVVQIGDHGNGEGPGLAGLGSRPTNAMLMWFDHFLRHHGELDGNQVVVEPMHHVFAAADKYPTWAEFIKTPRRYHLHQPSHDAGSMSQGTPGPAWQHRFQAGAHTVAETAEALVQTGILERLGSPQRYQTAEISLDEAVVWRSNGHLQRQRISGEVKLHLTVRPQAQTATLVAYLYDIPDAIGIRDHDRIITSAAYTIRNAQPEQATTIDLAFQLTDYDLSAGNSLKLVIDTKDRFLADETVAATFIEVLHGETEPAYLDIPIGPFGE